MDAKQVRAVCAVLWECIVWCRVAGIDATVAASAVNMTAWWRTLQQHRQVCIMHMRMTIQLQLTHPAVLRPLPLSPLASHRCAGVCDDGTGICYCDGPHFGRVPAPEGSPAGSPPIRPGRLLHGNCQRLSSDDKGQQLSWGASSSMSYDDVYGAQVSAGCVLIWRVTNRLVDYDQGRVVRLYNGSYCIEC
jgi:hypothetical protein